MAQYEGKFGSIKYDDEKINASKDLLKSAEQALNGTEAAITAGFTSLAAARGIQWIDCMEERQNIQSIPGQYIDYIEELYNAISNKAKEIEEYRDSPWYKKVFATLGMGVTKLLEGVATVGENIVDAGVSLVGFAGGLFSQDFQDSCAEFVKQDGVGGFFSEYINGSDTWLGKYSSMSPNSTGANFFKGIGVAAGYIALAAATGGVAGISSTTANVAVAAVGGLGSGTETGLQQGKSFNAAFVQGIKQGAIQGGTAYLAGRIGDKIQANAMDDVVQNGGQKAIAMGADGKAARMTNTLYKNAATDAIESGAKNFSDDAINALGTKATKVMDKVKGNGVVQKITNNGVVKGTTNYVGNVAKDTVQLGKTVVSPATKVISKAGGVVKAAANSKFVNGAIGIAAANPVVGNAVSAALVTTPILSNEIAQSDIVTESSQFSLPERDISVPDPVPGPVPEHVESVNNNLATTPSSGEHSASSSGQQGNVSYRVSSSGGGSGSYTPSSTATPSHVSDVSSVSNPNPSLNTNTGNSSNTSTNTNDFTNNSDNSIPSTNYDNSTPSTDNNSGISNGNDINSDNNSYDSNDSNVNTPIQSTTSTSSSGTSHSGGGYSEGGFSFAGTTTDANPTGQEAVIDTGDSSVGAGKLASSVTSTSSFGNQTIKIPTTPDSIQQSSSGTNMVIPTAAAISTAAAAGIGAKAYMEHKENSKNDDEEFSEGEENNGFYTEEWNGNDDDIKIDYGTEKEQTLDDDVDDSYSADSIIQKYEAVNSSELESVQ